MLCHVASGAGQHATGHAPDQTIEHPSPNRRGATRKAPHNGHTPSPSPTMAKHKAATEITIIQEERSAFAETVDRYKWHGLGLLVVLSALIVWRQRAGVAAVKVERADWAEFYNAQNGECCTQCGETLLYASMLLH